MTGPLSGLGRSWDEMVDQTLAFHGDLLRRAACEMADALDRAAMRDIEGAKDWRDLTRKETRYASARS